MSKTGKQPIVSILLAQAVVSGLVAALLAVWQGGVAGVSALAGGAVAVIPNAFLAARLLQPADSAGAVLRAAWLGEIGKLVMTAIMFAAIFIALRPVSVAAVFAGFIAAQLVLFGLPLVGGGWLDGKDNKAES